MDPILQPYNKDYMIDVYESKRDELNVYLKDLKQIIENGGSQLEGNCFYEHCTLNIKQELLTKQINLFWAGTLATKRICEIGFNAGHSSLLLLLGRDKTPLDFTVFDMVYHPYVKPTFEYVKSNFPHINFEFVEGDSITEVPKWMDKNKDLCGQYDVIHVDGGHSEECIKNDMYNMNKLLRVNGIMIVDDTNDPNINNYVNMYLNSGKYVEVDILTTSGYSHRMIRKIKN